MVVDFSKETNWYAYHVIYFVLSLRKAQLIYRLAVSHCSDASSGMTIVQQLVEKPQDTFCNADLIMGCNHSLLEK